MTDEQRWAINVAIDVLVLHGDTAECHDARMILHEMVREDVQEQQRARDRGEY